MSIPLPPLDEQRRIVARIEELSAKIEEARSLRRESIQELTAIIPAMGRKLLGQVNASVTPLRTWLQGENDGVQTGPFGAQLSSTEFTISGVPVLTIGNVQYGGLKLDTLKFVSEEKADQLSRYRIKEGDFLFARMGTVGRCCIVPKEAEGWLINYHIIRVRVDRTRVEPRFIHWTIQASGEVEEYLGEKIRGATREGVNSAIVGGLPCRIPPIPEQLRIIEFLDDLQAKVDAVKKLKEETAEELDALMPSILSRAFSGTL
jgi:type I restriction enzyme S subunit